LNAKNKNSYFHLQIAQTKIYALGVLLICGLLGGFALPAFAATTNLSIAGQGLAPLSIIEISTVTGKPLTTKADGAGSFRLQNLPYNANEPLVFSLRYNVRTSRQDISNFLTFNLNPFTGSNNIEGQISKAGSIVINLSGEDSQSAFANQNGFIQARARAVQTGLADGDFVLRAHITNITETCCPRLILPVPPVQLTVSATSGLSQKGPIERYVSKEMAQIIYVGSSSYAVSVPEEKFDSTYMAGLRQVANQLSAAIAARTASLGTFINATMQQNVLLALQQKQSDIHRDFRQSDGVCRFASLSSNLADQSGLKTVGQTAFADILLARDFASKGTLADLGETQSFQARVLQFQYKFCDPLTNNNALQRFCFRLPNFRGYTGGQARNRDFNFNADIDFTRSFDYPLTLPKKLNEEIPEGVLALAQNLYPALELDENSLSGANKEDDFTELRGLVAIRSVARNSFVTQAALKSPSDTNTTQWQKALMTEMGLSEPETKHLLDGNSYHAQMEILTKKLFQTPRFLQNLIENPSNVKRQRVAIKSVDLMQGQDLLEALQRREMLLATLVELKLRQSEKTAQQNLISRRN
jgi:hypothetical protein